MEKRAPELLMPAGDSEKLRYAFAYGADAVYAGVPIFSLRARENSFTKDSLQEGIKLAHDLGKKLYLTMNIYAHNTKIQRFLDSFLEMSDLGPDGFIMTDTGLIKECLRLKPDTVVHLSTQANVTNWLDVKFWHELGVKRIILSRELSLGEITEMHARVPEIELEAFVHGAICVAYSGRCLISNYLNHRDANQGVCTNSCRWQYKLAVDRQSFVEYENEAVKEREYAPLKGDYVVHPWSNAEENFMKESFPIDEDENGTYLMNAKDLCAIELIDKLHAAGVCSLKIEGRTKSEYYVATVARAYRRAIDDMIAGREFNKENLMELIATQNRTMTTGFLVKRPEEYGQNYNDGYSAPHTHRYAARVKSYDAETQIAWVEMKNRVEKGTALEWFSPTQTQIATVNEIYNARKEAVDTAHGGLVLGIKVPFDVDDMWLARQRLQSE
ncbi:MAG: U32 family peptidase C-terminal domain-containing protein [Deltaproteobacteria bacterium]|nr:U32 family peptidase C-terminal domain-containing protein [Deltaproteobacteria bacterium]